MEEVTFKNPLGSKVTDDLSGGVTLNDKMTPEESIMEVDPMEASDASTNLLPKDIPMKLYKDSLTDTN